MFCAMVVLPRPCGATRTMLRSVVEEVESHRGLDEIAINALRPVPIEVCHGFEAAEVAARETPLDTSLRAILMFLFQDVFEKLLRGHSLASRERDQIVECSARWRDPSPTSFFKCQSSESSCVGLGAGAWTASPS